MKKTILLTGILIFLIGILLTTDNNVNSNTINFSVNSVYSSPLKVSKVNYPIKVHVAGLSEGESFTYYLDRGVAQTVNKSSFLLNLSSGDHSICIQSSGNKYGYINFFRNDSPMLQDIYVNIQNSSLNFSPCQNIK